MFQPLPITKTVSLQDGLAWRGGGDWTYEEKKDGWRAAYWDGFIRGWAGNELQPLAGIPDGTELDGELCKDGFWVFDILRFDGVQCDKLPLRERIDLLRGLKLPQGVFHIPRSAGGGEFLEAVLSKGGEGIVAKRLGAPYGFGWVRCKRQETHDCVVTELHPKKASMRLSLAGEDCGWCTIPGKTKITAGDIVEILCHSRHPSGKFREPRFIRLRPDKVH